MRLSMLSLLSATAMAVLLNGCSEQRAAEADAGAVRPSAAADDARPLWASAMGQDPYGIWADIILAGVTQRVRWIPPGTFAMGSPGDEPGRSGNEALHSVIISHGFWLAETTCTQAMWQAVMGSNPSLFAGDPQRPVDTVSWRDCQDFLSKVNGLNPKAQARLSTEAEWEYACRAGTTGPFNGFSLDTLGWYYGNSGPTTHPVKLKAPNAWGLYDMHGNLWQWCSDWYGDYPTEATTNPTGPASGSVRVRRGGSWDNVPVYCRSANRDGRAPGYSGYYLGFRLCISAQAVTGN